MIEDAKKIISELSPIPDLVNLYVKFWEAYGADTYFAQVRVALDEIECRRSPSFIVKILLARMFQLSEFSLWGDEPLRDQNADGEYGGALRFWGDGSIQIENYPGPSALGDPYWECLRTLVDVCAQMKKIPREALS